MPELQHNLPTADRDNALADKIDQDFENEYSKATESAQMQNKEQLRAELQKQQEEKLRQMGMLTQKDIGPIMEQVGQVMEEMKKMREENQKLKTFLLKKAAQGQNPYAEGKGTIGAPLSDEEQQYADLEKEFGPLTGYLRKPSARRT